VLAGLGERGLHEDVVHRDRGGQVGQRLVPAQVVGDAVEAFERLAEAPGQLTLGGFQGAADVGVAALHDLAHEAREEDRVSCLVDLLRGQEVLLLLLRRGVDVGREVVGDGVFAVEEQGVVPERGPALKIGPLVVPLVAVLREVDLGRAPVALLPALVQVLVRDPVNGGRRRGHVAPLASCCCPGLRLRVR
jgi:hypothetical protein